MKTLKELHYHIERMKREIPFIKNQRDLDNHVATINTMINAGNDLQLLLDNGINTDVFERMVLGRLYIQMRAYSPRTEVVPIDYIYDQIIDEITLPIHLHREKIIQFMQGKDLDQYINMLPLKNEDSPYGPDIDFTGMDKKTIIEISNNFSKCLTGAEEHYNQRMDEMIQQLKFLIEIDGID